MVEEETSPGTKSDFKCVAFECLFFFPVSLPTSKLFGEACDAVRDAGVGMLQNKMLLRTIT